MSLIALRNVLILRSPQSGRLEGRTASIQRFFDSFTRSFAGMTLIVAVLVAPAAAGEEPKYGGTLTYMIPADAPPSFDAHREGTFATVHSAAPFYSVLIRVCQGLEDQPQPLPQPGLSNDLVR